MPSVGMRRKTRVSGVKVLRSGKRLLNGDSGEVGKQRGRVLRSGKQLWIARPGKVRKQRHDARAATDVDKVLIRESTKDTTPLKDSGRDDDRSDLNQENTKMDIDESIVEQRLEKTESVQGAVYQRKSKKMHKEMAADYFSNLRKTYGSEFISKRGRKRKNEMLAVSGDVGQNDLRSSSQLSCTFGSSSVQKRRSPLRPRKGKTCSPFVRQKANVVMPPNSSPRHDITPFSPAASGKMPISPVGDNCFVDVKSQNSSFSGLAQNVDTSTCSANILVIEFDRCYREEGAVVRLEKSASKPWFIAVEKDGGREYNIVAQQVMRPCSFNRITHATIWTFDNSLRLEFPNKRDWLIFKKLYEECSDYNIQAPAVSMIPVPRVLEVSSYGNCNSVSFRRPQSYITWKDDELSRALAKGTANYDLDSDDELWLEKFNNEYFEDNQLDKHLSAATFELIINSFEKGFYCGHDDYSDVGVAVDLSVNLERKEVLEAVHGYWIRKRQLKKSALARVFQCYQQRETENSTKVILRKKRSSNRQINRCGRSQQRTILQAERDAIVNNDTSLKAQATTVADMSEGMAILKRRSADVFVERAKINKAAAMAFVTTQA